MCSFLVLAETKFKFEIHYFKMSTPTTKKSILRLEKINSKHYLIQYSCVCNKEAEYLKIFWWVASRAGTSPKNWDLDSPRVLFAGLGLDSSLWLWVWTRLESFFWTRTWLESIFFCWKFWKHLLFSKNYWRFILIENFLYIKHNVLLYNLISFIIIFFSFGFYFE